MLCTKSHVYVDKVTKCCALNHICMSPRLLKNMHVSSNVVGSYLIYMIYMHVYIYMIYMYVYKYNCNTTLYHVMTRVNRI